MNITNLRIITFFKQHSNLEPETIILRFIDIMESLHESMHSSMNNTMVFDMLNKLKQMDSKIDKVAERVNTITDDTQTQFTLKMAEFKKEYLAELNMVLTCNVSDKIAPLVKEQNEALFNKTNAMIKEVIPRNETFVSEGIEKMVSKFRESVNMETTTMIANSVDKETFSKYLSDFNSNMGGIIASSQGLINEAISRSEEKLENKIDNIQQLSINSNHNTISLHSSVGDLLKKV